MLDRREFLVKSAGAGVALAGGGLLSAPLAIASNGKGYVPGQKCPAIVGHEQYEGKLSLGHLRGRWVLLDICAEWCVDCGAGARQYPGLVAEASEHGIPLSVLTVLREQAEGITSDRAAAEEWANGFGYQHEWVLHCGGSSTSPLAKLLDEVCAANGVESAYPSHLLIDPTGVVRYFQQGLDTEKLKGELAKAAGVALNGSYSIGEWVPPLGPQVQIATITFGIQHGGTASETLAVGSKGKYCSLAVTTRAGAAVALFTLNEGLTVDLNVPISILVHPGARRSYEYAKQPPEFYEPVALWAGQPKEDGSNLVALGGRTNIVNTVKGSSGVSSVQPATLEHGEAWGTPATVIELELYLVESSVYEGVEQLVKGTSNKAAQKLLKKGLKDLSHHDFVDAFTAIAQATTILGYGEETAANAAWLANN